MSPCLCVKNLFWQRDAELDFRELIGRLANFDSSWTGLDRRATAEYDKSVQYSDPNVVDIASDNLLANIHSDPRWLPFLRKAKDPASRNDIIIDSRR